MLGIWIASVTLVGGLLVLAAHLVQRALRTRRRWLWTAALVAAPVLATLDALPRSILPRTASIDVIFGPAAPAWGAVLRGFGAAATAAPARTAAALLAGVWVVATLALLGCLAVGVSRIRRRRRRWRPGVVDGVAVLVSETFGPAVVGVRHPDIVLPRWVLDLSPEERALVLAHEEEHLRRGDSGLLAAAFAFAAVLPWNLPGWWALFRLRDAVETDCDARVLAARTTSRNRYARLLFEVGSRSLGAVPLGAGFGERVSSLERRIREMLEAPSGRRRLTLQALVAGVLVVAACTIEVNVDKSGQKSQEQAATAPRAAAEVAPTASDAQLEKRPTFTPYTVAPTLLNRQEMARALQRDYPPLLKKAGIGGRVLVNFYIDAKGQVHKTLIDESSGHKALDDAALRVAGEMRFSPALNRDKRVPVWVTFPITFEVK